MSNSKRLLIVHPLVFAAFPVLFLFSHNVNQTRLAEIAIPLLIVVCFALLSWLLLILFVKDKGKAGIIVSIFLLLFFSYGHVFDAISGLTVGELVIGSHKYLTFAWVILFVSGAYLITRTRKNLHNLTKFLNVVAVSLCAISIITAVYAYPRQDNINTENKVDLANFTKSGKRPDIYYIILDGYARVDILKEIYQYDNTPFLDSLAQKGFYIAEESRTNYPYTILSLASVLNFNYLDDLVNRYGAESNNTWWPLIEMINNNRVIKFLKQKGYRIVLASTTRFLDDAINTADIYISSPYRSLTEFQSELINTTPVPMLLILLAEKTGKWGDFRYDLHRERILYVLDHLADMTKKERDYPVFVFAHIIAPHAPFVFGKNGEKIKYNPKFSITAGGGYTGEAYVEKYKNQLIFISGRIEKAIDDILSNSPEPPIIIMQSDHGPASMLDWKNPYKSNFKERMSILNAFYLPDNDYEKLYKEITPVNTFRIIFNYYFDTNYELLRDESYFSSHGSYKFINVTDKIKSSQ